MHKSRKVTLKELQSLVGLLNFCCAVVKPDRCFLRRLIDKESRRDLLEAGKGLSSPQLNLYTDAACSLGHVAIFGKHWFFGKWTPVLFAHHIAYKELFPI